MDEWQEKDGDFRPKRKLSERLAMCSAYQTPLFTTISAAKSQDLQTVKPKHRSINTNKNKVFSVQDLFLTDG